MTWKNPAAKKACAKRVAELRGQVTDPTDKRKVSYKTGYLIVGITSVLCLMANGFGISYFVVHDVLGKMAPSEVTVLGGADELQQFKALGYDPIDYYCPWCTYRDPIGHYHTTTSKPRTFPWTKIHGPERVNAFSTDKLPVWPRYQLDKPIVSKPHGRATLPQQAGAPAHKRPWTDWRGIAAALQPFAQLAALMGVFLFMWALKTRRKYIRTTEHGIVITDDWGTKLTASSIVPWECLQKVDIVTMFEPILRLTFDHGQEQIRWHDVVSQMEPGEFINALRTWAPEAVRTCKFPTENSLTTIDDHAYTKLWFKYYSTGTQRERAGQLSAGDELQNGRFKVSELLGGGGQGTAYLAMDRATHGVAPTVAPAVASTPHIGATAAGKTLVGTAHVAEERPLPAGIASGLSPAATINTDATVGAMPCIAHSEVVLKEYILPVHRGQQVMEHSAQRLRQEAEILRKIDHPNIVKLLGEFTEDHRGYLVMEYVQGTHLKALVATEGPQPEATVRDLALQICDILAYLHSMDPAIIHRDLTPDNLILQSDGIVKLVDFNVAHQLESQATATVVGKHAYIPPEQFRGKPTVQSDIYALGCTLHFLLTGEEPEPLTVSRPRTLNERVSEKMNQIIATCTALDPTKRYATVEDVKGALLAKPGAPVVIKLSQTVEA